MPRYEAYAKVKEIYNISPETVRNWAKRGQIKYKCIQNKSRKTWLYDVDSIGELIRENTDSVEGQEEERCLRPTRVIYVRVSSAKQSADLDRQRELLSAAFPDATVISDIASGLNFRRPGFTRLVQQICRDKVSQVVVTFKDRIARFGYELFELICREHGCTILVHGENIDGQVHNDESDLKDDLLAVVNVFVASHNRKRAAALKKERKGIGGATQRVIEGEALPDQKPAEEATKDVPSE